VCPRIDDNRDFSNKNAGSSAAIDLWKSDRRCQTATQEEADSADAFDVRDIDFPGGRRTEINDSSTDIGAAIIDANDHFRAGVGVLNENQGLQRKAWVSRGHQPRHHFLATGGFLAGEAIVLSIERSQTDLDSSRTGDLVAVLS